MHLAILHRCIDYKQPIACALGVTENKLISQTNVCLDATRQQRQHAIRKLKTSECDQEDQGSVIILQLGKTKLIRVLSVIVFTVGFLQYAPEFFLQVCIINALLLTLIRLVPTAYQEAISPNTA
ncbi:hypothetical protein C9J01_07790 [Photobacterium rosenbergii]|uniref:Uncharacterized protein n=1 Tax=Photobacterium rosenbergii TaxID=294936 RepID=A0A2T3NH58_9GAMM|nr:hypothetical protein C9J01_07790 [Photobacterium rosenbergii]